MPNLSGRRGPRSAVTEEMLPTIQAMHKDGHAVTVIARKLDVPAKALYPVMRRMGLVVTKNARRSGLAKKQIAELVAAYQRDELSTQELAARCGVHANTVARYIREAGIELRPAGFQPGDQHHAWRGGRIETDEYVFVLLRPEDPFYEMGQLKNGEGAGRYVLEHRYVMAKKLGRPLTENETVHHKDLNGKNNDPGNLQLRIGKHGKGAVFQCIDCGSYNIEALSLGGAPH